MIQFTPAEIRTLKMWGSEKTAEQLARMVHRPPDQVAAEAARLGIELAVPRPARIRPAPVDKPAPAPAPPVRAPLDPAGPVCAPVARPAPVVVLPQRPVPETAPAPRRVRRKRGYIETEDFNQEPKNLAEVLRRAAAYIRRGESLSALRVLDEALGKRKAPK